MIIFDFFYHLHSVLGWIQICQNIRVYLSNSNFYLETSESLSIFLFIASFISLAWSLFYNWQWAVIIRPKFVSHLRERKWKKYQTKTSISQLSQTMFSLEIHKCLEINCCSRNNGEGFLVVVFIKLCHPLSLSTIFL